MQTLTAPLTSFLLPGSKIRREIHHTLYATVPVQRLPSSTTLQFCLLDPSASGLKRDSVESDVPAALTTVSHHTRRLLQLLRATALGQPLAADPTLSSAAPQPLESVEDTLSGRVSQKQRQKLRAAGEESLVRSHW